MVTNFFYRMPDNQLTIKLSFVVFVSLCSALGFSCLSFRRILLPIRARFVSIRVTLDIGLFNHQLIKPSTLLPIRAIREIRGPSLCFAFSCASLRPFISACSAYSGVLLSCLFNLVSLMNLARLAPHVLIPDPLNEGLERVWNFQTLLTHVLAGTYG